MKHAAEMASGGMIYISSVMTFVSGIQVILHYYLKSVRVCHVGITDGRNYEHAIRMA
jgi:hypothetical protein